MIGAPGLLPALVGAAAGGLLALAAREALLASPAAARWLRLALEPLRRAGREGYAPSTRGAAPTRRARRRRGGRRRLAAGGPALALPLSVAGPALAGWAISSRRRRYRAAVERSLPEVATAVADSLSAGRSLRASLPPPPASSTARRRPSWPGSAPSSTSARRPTRRSRPGGGGCARSGSTPSPPRCSASGSPAATWRGCCAASPRAPRSATGSPRTPARRPPRPASPACSWSRCRAAAPSSPS